MPKSKRNKQISLTRTKKSGMELKKHLVEEVRSCVDNYANVFVYSVNDMRNSKLKYVREQWKHGRFFFGKNNVMALALGRTPEEEYKEGLHKVSGRLKGQCGLFFSNQSKEEVLNWFANFSDADYSRAGNIAQFSVQLPEGPLPQFSHSLEPYLRQLGMPTALQKGIVHLIKDYEVCKEGDTLTPEIAKILKLLGHQMAEFRISIECCWSNDGNFQEISKSVDSNSKMKENIAMEIDSVETVFKKPKDPKSVIAGDQNLTNHEITIEEPDHDDLKNNSITITDEDDIANDKKENGDEVENEDDIANDKKENGDEVENEENIDEELSSNESELEDNEEKPEILAEAAARKHIFNIEKLNEVNSSPDEKSPIIRSLRNRTVKVIRKKSGK